MSTAHEAAADFASAVELLENLAVELRGSRGWRVPEVSAACDALTCAAALLRTQQDSVDGDHSHTELLHDAIGLARSTVEATKWAARERIGSHRVPHVVDGRGRAVDED
ncbi:hypothetical protein SAMN05192558_101536 [Actinokineospora alba]|uniref:Uncharacterized protein n=1 Tax=Actinokineospora alba TaxID=504798 RepID=A0A1H0FVF4_9PSEU|nr:hypothetical protein [Actinokineospora alba]TDP69638.1 hypothetical protein C8E96_5231 [Actinokineospora alba]SDI12387.1 hypothetical protein SAMN05421871_103335 [Actinokineospora alba]SDN98647.1 hypothetical protein SAMN05192558_101536 [Actinokineospora alba]